MSQSKPSTHASLVPLPRQGGAVTPFSLQAQEALDRVEDDAGRIELAVTLVTQALGQLERASIDEQVDTVRYAGDRLQQIGDASPGILAELERQLYNYAASQGGLMDDVRAQVREILLDEIGRRPLDPTLLDDVLALILRRRRRQHWGY